MRILSSLRTLLSVAVLLAAGGLLAPASIAGDAAGGAELGVAAPSAGAVAYYFHGNVRCATCRKIEAYADEAVHAGFGDVLESGGLTWRVVNIDDDANRHFIDDFQLVTRSVVLADYRDGKVVRFKNLDRVWQLVRDKEAFVDYVQSETRGFLGEG